MALGGCHASATGAADRSQGSWTGGAALDSHGSVPVWEVLDKFPFRVLFDADPLFWSQPSAEEPELTEGDWVRDNQLSTFAAPAPPIGGAGRDVEFQGSVGGEVVRPPHGSDG